MQRHSSPMSGVMGIRKRSQKLNFLSDMNDGAVMKNSTFKEPKCSLSVMVRLVLSDSEEKSAMEVWRAIRLLFPYYRRCAQFHLRCITQVLKTSKDVAVRNVDGYRPNSVERKKYRLRNEVQFSYRVNDVIGKGRTLDEVTNSPDELNSCLQRRQPASNRECDHYDVMYADSSSSIGISEASPLREEDPAATALPDEAPASHPSSVSSSVPKVDPIRLRSMPLPLTLFSSPWSPSASPALSLARNSPAKKRKKTKKHPSLRQRMHKKFSLRNKVHRNHAKNVPLWTSSFSSQANAKNVNIKLKLKLLKNSQSEKSSEERCEESRVNSNSIAILNQEDSPMCDNLSEGYATNISTTCDKEGLERVMSPSLPDILDCVDEPREDNTMQYSANEVHDSGYGPSIIKEPELKRKKVLDSVRTHPQNSDINTFSEERRKIIKREETENRISNLNDIFCFDKNRVFIDNSNFSPLKENIFPSRNGLSLKSIFEEDYQNMNNLSIMDSLGYEISDADLIKNEKHHYPLQNISNDTHFLMDIEEVESPTTLKSPPEGLAIQIGSVCPEDHESGELEIAYVKEGIASPDSTDATLKTKRHQLPNALNNIKRKISAQKYKDMKSMCVEETESDELVTSSTSGDALLPVEGGCDSSGSISPNDIRVSALQDTFESFKCKFEWINYDPGKVSFSCSACNNLELSSGLRDSIEVESILVEHDFSEVHTLFPFLLRPELLDRIYTHLKSCSSLPSALHFKKDMVSYLSELDFQPKAELTYTHLLKLFEKYTEDKIISTIRNSSLPFSVTLNFCERIAILRTADESGMHFECVLVIKSLRDRSVIGFLNSLNLSASRVMFFNVWPACQNCSNCMNTQGTLVENQPFILPPKFPCITELISIICRDAYIFPYFSFVSQLQILYDLRPHHFNSLKDAHVLKSKSLWNLREFIYKNFLALRGVCLEIFHAHGDISAIGIVGHQINLDDEFMLTLKIISKCEDYARRMKENDVQDINRKQVHPDTRRELEELKREIEVAQMHGRIKDYLLEFLNETTLDLYFEGRENALDVYNLCYSSYLKNLNQLSPAQRKRFLKVFEIFEKFLETDLELVIKELVSFGYLLSLEVSRSFLAPQQLLALFRNNPKLCSDFPVAHKFYCLFSILPMSPTSTSSSLNSHYAVRMKRKLIKSNFGEASPFITPIAFDGSPSTGLKGLHQYLKEQIYLFQPP